MNEEITLHKEVQEETEQQKVLAETITIIKNQLFKKKEDIVRLRLKQLGKLNILNYSNHRFKKLSIDMYPDREEVWIDNGTPKGKRLVTFFAPKETDMKDEEVKLKLVYKFD